MGKEWHWGSGRSSKTGGGGGGGGGGDEDFSGCMCSVFQLFDFQFPSHQQPQQPPLSLKPETFLPEDPPKGAEAPRNSLELDQPLSSWPTAIKEDESLKIPMGIQIKTNGDAISKSHGTLNDSSSSEISSSPSTKTPNLVARLMGLDILPDQCSSSTSSLSTIGTPNPTVKSHLNRRPSIHSDFAGTRSLPETPRISSARRSDVEHRLSLQINKENMSPSEELVLSRFSSLKRRELRTEEENRSPGHYARQIVKQVKESVSRRVGLDITNTVKTRDHHEIVSQLKSKKLTTRVGTDNSSPGKASCSPRLKFLEPKNKDQNIFSVSTSPPIKQVNVMPQKTKPLNKPKLQEKENRHQQQQQQKRSINKCKKVEEETFGPPTRPKQPPQTWEIIRNKQEEPFVRSFATTRPNIPDKKCKKTNDLLNILPVKKDPTPPATKIPQKQALSNIAQQSKRSSQLSSCSSHSYKQQEAKHNTALDARGYSGKNEDRSNGAVIVSTTGDGGESAEYEYITRILKRTGIDKDTTVSFTRWFSPSHPLDPSIFYYLEHFTTSEKYGQMSHRSNRKLFFQLVDEVLAEILKPYMNMKPWANASGSNIKASNLIDMLCSKVRSFPRADCRVLEDIDALVNKDMPPLKVQCEMAFCEEGEGIVMEMEKDLLDTLVHETASCLYGKG